MGVATSVALALAERMTVTGGPRAGLLAYRPLLTSGDGEVRAKAILASIQCALALRDELTLAALIERWGGARASERGPQERSFAQRGERGAWDGPVAALCKEMARPRAGSAGASGRAGASPMLPHAVALARAEATRHPSARALYLLARCLDVSEDPAAPAAFDEAIARAEEEGRGDIALASRVRRAVLLSRSWETMGEALEVARQIELPRVPPASRVDVARVLLLSPSRFVRATAIGELDALVLGALGQEGSDPALASRALSLAARFADDAGDVMTPLERDRLDALFRRPSVVKALASVAAQPDEAATGRSSQVAQVVQMLDVARAIRSGSPALAAHVLGGLVLVEERGAPLPSGVLAVARAALMTSDDELRAAGARFFAARLRRPRPGAPPGGYLALADALSVAGREDLAAIARRAAVVANEVGAVELLGTMRAREGWALAQAGDRERAIEALREAKALLAPPTPR